MAQTARCASGSRRLPRDQWEVLITDHHRGFIDWDTYQANQARIGANIRPQARQPGTGAVREGCALLQGLATCGTCGRKLAVFYAGPAKSMPDYYCQGSAELVDGRGARHLRVGGQAIDAAVAAAFLAALAARRAACLPGRRPPARRRPRRRPGPAPRQVEQARYHAARAERRYRAVDPDNRLVARGLEAEWETALQRTGRRRGRAGPPPDRTPENPDRRTSKPAILALGDDLRPGLGRAHHHRQGPQAAAAHPAR